MLFSFSTSIANTKEGDITRCHPQYQELIVDYLNTKIEYPLFIE